MSRTQLNDTLRLIPDSPNSPALGFPFPLSFSRPLGKAFRTGSLPGITRKLTGTVKINENPSIYVYDTPGVMVTYLGKGEEGAEKGMKLGLTGEWRIRGSKKT